MTKPTRRRSGETVYQVQVRKTELLLLDRLRRLMKLSDRGVVVVSWRRGWLVYNMAPEAATVVLDSL